MNTLTSRHKMATGERQMENEKVKSIFCELSADDLEPEITEVESLCFECDKNVGNSYLNLIKISYN